MTNFMRKLMMAVTGAMLLVTPAAAGEYRAPVETKVITSDGGGVLFEYMENYTNARRTGTLFKVDGLCASACTLVLGMIPQDRVCATEYARFGFHYAYTLSSPFGGERKTSVEGTNMLETYYPQKVMEALKVKGWNPKGDKENVMFFLSGAELGVKDCN